MSWGCNEEWSGSLSGSARDQTSPTRTGSIISFETQSGENLDSYELLSPSFSDDLTARTSPESSPVGSPNEAAISMDELFNQANACPKINIPYHLPPCEDDLRTVSEFEAQNSVPGPALLLDRLVVLHGDQFYRIDDSGDIDEVPRLALDKERK
jgi:hypothetical protein